MKSYSPPRLSSTIRVTGARRGREREEERRRGKDALLVYEGVNEGTLHVSRVLLELKHLARTYHFHPLTEEERKERGREIVFVAAANAERYIYPPWFAQRPVYTA